MRKTKTAFAFLTATATTFLLASISHTLFVLNELVNLDISISSSVYTQTILDDLQGLLPGYGAVIALGFLIAFTALKLLSKELANQPNPAWFWWGIAGGLTLLSALLLMQPLLDITLIAGARSGSGFAVQCMAGVCGGIVYGILRPQTLRIGEKSL